MPQLDIQFPQKDVDALMKSIDKQSRLMGIPVLEATQNAAKLVAYSAKAATKEAKAYRKYEVKRKPTAKRMGNWKIRNDKPNKKDFFVMASSVKELKEKRSVRIGRRGLAKKTWEVIGAQVPGSSYGRGGSDNASNSTSSQAKKFGTVKISKKPLEPSVTLTNSLKYAIAAVRGGESAISKIVGKASRRMITMTNAIIKRNMKTT